MTPKPSTQTLSLVSDALSASVTLAQMLQLASACPQLEGDRVFQARYNAQEALLNGLAEAIQEPFFHISVNEIKRALTHCSLIPEYSPAAYGEFLAKLRAEGGDKVALAFETLKAPGA